MKKISYKGQYHLPKELPKVVLDQSFLTSYSHGEQIHQANTPLDYLFFMIKGKGKILLTQENGKTTIIQFIHQNDWIGELTILGAETETREIRSIGHTICLAIPMSVVTAYLLNDITFIRLMGAYAGHKLVSRTMHFSKNQNYILKHRIAIFILEVSSDNLYQENHMQVAEYLGVSYRHLLHTFKDFRQEGLVTKVGYQCFKINLTEIEKLAIQDPN